jgi:hypothetical protein
VNDSLRQKVLTRFLAAMPIRPFLDGHRFDAETTRLMGIARKTVVAALHTRADLKPPRSPYHHRSGENRRERPQASLRGGPESRAVYPIVNAPTPFRLTLHRRCCRIHELQPVRGGAGPVARSQPLRDNPIPIGRQHRPRSARGPRSAHASEQVSHDSQGH